MFSINILVTFYDTVRHLKKKKIVIFYHFNRTEKCIIHTLANLLSLFRICKALSSKLDATCNAIKVEARHLC